MIHFQCTHCGQVFNAPEEMAGDSMTCTHCRQSMLIPLSSTIAAPDSSESAAVSAPKKKVPIKSSKKTLGAVRKSGVPKKSGSPLTTIIIIGVVLLLLGGGFFFILREGEKQKQADEQSQIEAKKRSDAEAALEKKNKVEQSKRDAEEAAREKVEKEAARNSPEKRLPLEADPQVDIWAQKASMQQRAVLGNISEPPPCSLKARHKIFLTQPNLFPILATPDYQVLAAGMVSDTGRAAFFADSEFPLTVEADPDPLLEKLLIWLSKKRGATIAVNKNVPLRRQLEAKFGEGFKFVDVSAGLANASAYDAMIITGSQPLSDHDVSTAIPNFLTAGKGILFSADAFTAPKAAEVLQQFGIATVPLKKIPSEIRFENKISMDLNSIVALEKLKKIVGGKWSPTKEEEKFIASALILTLKDIPAGDALVLPVYKKVTDRLPSLRKPKKDVIGMLGGAPFTLAEKVKIACIDAELRNTPMDKQKPHPAAEFYPGLVNRNAQRENADVRLNLAMPYINSTGYYAPPGEPVEVEIPESATQLGLKAILGINLNELAPEDDWYRASDIVRYYDLTEAVTTVVNPYGGPLYIAVPDKEGFTYPPPSAMANASTVTPKAKNTVVTLRGGVRMGRYVIGQNTPGDWDNLVTLYENRKLPPLVEIECPAVILTLPSKGALELVDRPEITSTIWEDVLDECKIFTGRDFSAPFPIRLTVDAMSDSHYNSYPISIAYTETKRLVDRFESKRHPSNEVVSAMIYFFLGKAQDLPGKSEVMRWLFSSYLIECSSTSHRRDVHPELSLKRQEEMCHEILNTPYRWNTASTFGKMIPYMQIVDEFGWATITDAVGEYSKVSDAEWPKTDEALNYDFAARLSRRANQNLLSFFKVWGWRMPSQPDPKGFGKMAIWMPESFPDSYLIIK